MFTNTKTPLFPQTPSNCAQNVYSGADNSLARPGRKQANISVRMAWISFDALSCRKKITWWQLASRCCWNRASPSHSSELVRDLVGLRIYQHPGINWLCVGSPVVSIWLWHALALVGAWERERQFVEREESVEKKAVAGSGGGDPMQWLHQTQWRSLGNHGMLSRLAKQDGCRRLE
jgi:hypothetical protein